MSSSDVRYIMCPGCVNAVRELNGSRCPHCQRCAFCGRKLPSGETACDCGLVENPEQVQQSYRDLGIPAENVPRERRRLEIRKELANRKVIISTVVGGITTAIASISYREWMGNPAAFQDYLYLGAFASFFVLISTHLISRQFTEIETRRLAKECPGAENPFRTLMS